MIRSLKADREITFVEFASDHAEHPHCCTCGNCLLSNPEDEIARGSLPVWCVGCRDMIDRNMPAHITRPWFWVKK